MTNGLLSKHGVSGKEKEHHVTGTVQSDHRSRIAAGVAATQACDDKRIVV